MIADQLSHKMLLLLWLLEASLSFLYHLFFILIYVSNLCKVQGKEEIFLNFYSPSVIFKKPAILAYTLFSTGAY